MYGKTSQIDAVSMLKTRTDEPGLSRLEEIDGDFTCTRKGGVKTRRGCVIRAEDIIVLYSEYM